MTPRTEAGKFLQAGLEALGFAADDAAERIVAIEIEAADCVLHDHTGPCIPEGPALRPSVEPAGREALAAALRDMTGAYHHERSHAGSWDECQRPRCQNARLALEGRGPFRLLPTQASDSPEKP